MSRTQHRITGMLIAVYIVTFSIFTIERYQRYNATGWDLGIFTHLVWNAAQGHPLVNTVAEYDQMLAIHSPYITILLAPLMWLWPDPRVLLLAQTVMLGLGAWPIARIAARRFRQPALPILFAALWLMYPALGWMNRWDFHEIAPAATFFAFAFDALDRRGWRMMTLWLVLALLCKEEVGLNLAFWGVFLIVQLPEARPRRFGIFLFIIGIAWFVLHAFVLFPTLRESSLPIHASRYTWIASAEGIASVLPTIPDRLAFLVKLFAPLGFLALLAPRPLLVALPTFALCLLSSMPGQYDIYMHYTAVIIPCVFVASIEGLQRWQGQHPLRLRFAIAVMIGSSLLFWLVDNPLWGSPPPGYTIYGWETGANVTALEAAKTRIPADACVVAENNLQPHYSTRRETYVLGARGNDSDGCAYMLLDLGDPRFESFSDSVSVACYQFWSGKRSVTFFQDGVVILEWNPAAADAAAQQQMQSFCDANT